jgi:hypothetical protein
MKKSVVSKKNSSSPVKKREVKAKGGTRKGDASPGSCFWVNHGPVCRNVTELYEAMKIMSDEQFAYHTKRNGNDFSSWVLNVFKDKPLSSKMARAKTRAGMLRTLSSAKK